MAVRANKLSKKGARGQVREGIRDQIAAGIALKDIAQAESRLRELGDDPDASSAQVSALNGFIAAKHKRISYILPQLKAVEHTGADGAQLEITVNVVPHAEPEA
jgi:hypothetical protein